MPARRRAESAAKPNQPELHEHELPSASLPADLPLVISAPTTPVDPARVLPHQVLSALRRIMRAVDLHSRDLLRRLGLTVPQLVILRELEAHDGASGNDLARAVSLSPPTVLGILDRLLSRGLIERHRSERDKRLLLVSLTAEGRSLVATAPTPLRHRFEERFAELATWEQHQILSVLERMVLMMELRDEEGVEVAD